MKKLFLSAISIALAASVYAIPHTFKEGDVLSAEKMNENFESLINSNVLRSTSVNCDEGQTINGAIKSGYNDITVSGTCNENLLYTVWRDSKGENEYQPSNKLSPRYLKLSGATADARIVDASANTENTISVNSGATLVLENITVSGGRYGVVATRNSNLLMTGGVTVEGFTERGIRVDDSSYLGVDEGGIVVSGGSTADRAFHIATGSSGWIENVSITGVKYGLYLHKSGLFINGATIEGAERGVVLDLGSQFTIYGADKPVTIANSVTSGITIWGKSHLTLADDVILNLSDGLRGIEIGQHSSMSSGGTINISNTSESGIRISGGGLNNWNGSITLSDLIGGRGIDLWQSKASINNLKLLDFNNVGSGWSPAIQITEGSNVDLENVQITGSTDEALIGIDRGSTAEIRNANISGDFDTLMMIGQSSYVGLNRSSLAGNAIGKLIGVFQLSTLTVRDSSIDSNSRGDGINLSNSSNLQLENVNIDSEDNSLYLTTGSVAQIRGNSNINSANGPSVVIDRGSGVRLGFGPKINSINDSVFEIRKSSWLDMDGFEEVGVPTENLVRQDPGPTISIRDMSFLSVGNGNYIEEVTCFGQSFVSLGGGIINDLSSSCTGDGNSGTSNNSDVGSLSDLQGSWLTTCQADGDSFSTELLEVNETDATISVSIYPDSECTTAEALFTASISNLSVGEGIDFDDGSSGYKFSLIQQGLTITPLFDEMAAQFNQYSLCGKTDWAPNQSTEVMGLSCDFEYPAKDVIQYGAYKILGSSLYLGESSPRGYPPNVDGYPFVKQ